MYFVVDIVNILFVHYIKNFVKIRKLFMKIYSWYQTKRLSNARHLKSILNFSISLLDRASFKYLDIFWMFVRAFCISPLSTIITIAYLIRVFLSIHILQQHFFFLHSLQSIADSLAVR